MTRISSSPLPKLSMSLIPMTTTDDLEIPEFLRRDKDNKLPDVAPVVKPLVFSYSILDNSDNVGPHQTSRGYVKKNLPFVEPVAMNKDNEIHTAMGSRLGGKPLPIH